MAMTQRRVTGSRLLGRELRRLRGPRRLEDVARATRANSAAGARPISVSALSEIENGKYLPSVDALVTLCLAYRVSSARFIGRVLEDRLVDGHDIPASPEALEAGLAQAMRDGLWPRALALAIVGLDRAKEPADKLRWRLRHAQALVQVGMLDQAVQELQDVLDDALLPAELRGRVHLDIANAASRAGHVTTAALHCEAVLARMPDDAPATFRMRALQAAVAIAIRKNALGHGSERELREALRRTEDARALLAPGDDDARLALDAYQAQIHDRLGNKTYAHKLYRKAEDDCERAGNAHVATCVLVSHAELLASVGRTSEARTRLEQAASLASSRHAVDHAFEAHALLMSLSRSEAERALHHRACRRYLSAATSLTPRMREFEASIAADGGTP